MNVDQELFDAMATGLAKAEDSMKPLGCQDWKVSLVARHPTNPKAFMVIGTRGDEGFQEKIGHLVEDEKMSFDTLASNVRQWAKDKGITEKATPLTQWDKMLEEVIETRDALVLDENHIRGQGEKITDGIGDVLVTAIILALLTNRDPVVCLEHAWDEIKGRTGKMVDGIFVKYQPTPDYIEEGQ